MEPVELTEGFTMEPSTGSGIYSSNGPPHTNTTITNRQLTAPASLEEAPASLCISVIPILVSPGIPPPAATHSAAHRTLVKLTSAS